MKRDIYHGFPISIDKMALKHGKQVKIIGGDGIERIKITLPGALNGK